MPELQIGRKNLWHKQFPTILGVLFLVLSLGVGLFFFSGGLGDFAPRATPQTTPKNIKVTNVTEAGFSVSFLTDESTTGFIKYGTAADDIKTQSSDDRDQLSGSVGQYSTHHVTLRNLQPNTEYFYILGTGSGTEFNNEGVPFTIKTTSSHTSTEAKTIYGNINLADGRPADGALVYVKSINFGELSAIVKSSGSWAIALANARSLDGSELALDEGTALDITVQGLSAAEITQKSVTLAAAQPVETLALGVGGASLASEEDRSLAGLPLDTPDTAGILPTVDDTTVDELNTLINETLDSSEPLETGGLTTLLDTSQPSAGNKTTASHSSEGTVVNLNSEAETHPVITTHHPLIKGTAIPSVLVTIEVHSQTQILQEVVTDENGEFELDIATLGTDLEPGEHTVTYSYVDPTTGETVSKTKTFTVAPKAGSTLIAQSSTGTKSATTTQPATSASTTGAGGPFGSGNPFPIPSATASASPVSTKSATTSSRPSRPSTQSGIPVSGSTGTTVALLIGGVFFILAGTWSYWVAQQIRENHE